ncbi:hypothetical protein GY45DRAFT_1373181 [Cubamyces sp. BRFM 1775]|nr:hypothetical protein GY45DRAFT_1373181 [Cubamyces sp. BRFM 1775]
MQLCGAIKQSLDESRATLYELINVSQPINKLPPETLCEILSLVPDDVSSGPRDVHPVSKWRPTFIQDVKQYRPLLLTCRYWNKLIMGTSAFWSTLEDVCVDRSQTTTSLFEKYIARCPNGPLCIFVRSGPTFQMRNMCRSPDFTSRIEQIVYNCEPPTTWGSCYSDFLSSSYSNLDTCVIRHDRIPHSEDYVPSPKHCRILPDSIRLRRLWIDHTNTLPATAFPALEELRVRNLYLYTGSEAPLCTFISNSPLLQVIELHAQFREYTPTELPDWQGQRVPLNALRDLTFTVAYPGRTQGAPAPGPFFRIFTTCFAIPPNCAIDCGRVWRPDQDSFLRLLNAASAVHSAHITSERNERAPTFSAVTADGVRLRFGVLAPGFQETVAADDPDGQRTASFGTISRDMDSRRTRLCTLLSSSPMLSQMRRLHVGSYAGWALLQPASVLSALCLLEHLVVADHKSFPPAFNASLLQYLITMKDEEPVMCPVLKSVVVDCQTPTDLPGPWWTAKFDKRDLLVCQSNIEDLAAARTSIGHPIERIRLFFTAEDPAAIAEGDRVTCMHEYDAAGSLVRTLRGTAAREVSEQDWYGL